MKEGKITHLPKYRTLGISYIMLDNRDGKFDALVNDTTFKKYLCDINFGIASSGIVEIKSHKEYSFEGILKVGARAISKEILFQLQ